MRIDAKLNAADVASRYYQLVEQMIGIAGGLLDTRFIIHKIDATIFRRVFCLFLALELRDDEM